MPADVSRHSLLLACPAVFLYFLSPLEPLNLFVGRFEAYKLFI